MGDRRRTYAHIAQAFFDTPWYIREPEGSMIGAIIRRRISGEALGHDEIANRIQAAREYQGPREGAATRAAVGVVPVYGVIFNRSNLMLEMSGGTTVGSIRASLRAALEDPEINAIVAEFDSPGGSTAGIEELATWIREARGQKPMVAVVNTMAASAAYYLAAQFDEVVATPSSLTGDIGVFYEHVEYSRQEEAEGVTRTIVRMPAAKHDINSSEPLPEAGLAYLQQVVSDYYEPFLAGVAAGRGVTVDAVRKGFGEGRSLTAQRAKAAGLVDRVDTFEATVQRLAAAALAEATGAAFAGGRLNAGDGTHQPNAEAAASDPTTAATAATDGHGASLEGQSSTPARRRGLEVFEAAYRGGYILPSGGTVS